MTECVVEDMEEVSVKITSADQLICALVLNYHSLFIPSC